MQEFFFESLDLRGKMEDWAKGKRQKAKSKKQKAKSKMQKSKKALRCGLPVCFGSADNSTRAHSIKAKNKKTNKKKQKEAEQADDRFVF